MRSALSLVALLLTLGAACVAGMAGVARADALNIDAAKNHFAAGKAYYHENRWEDALREFHEAHRLSKRPALLYNIALCNERLLRYDEAVETLRNYLKIDPNAEGRADIERKIADLDTARKNTRPGERPPPLPVRSPSDGSVVKGSPQPPTPPVIAAVPGAAEPKPQPAPRRRLATWIVGAAGVALLAAGAGTAVASHSDFQTLNDLCGPTRSQCPEGWEATRDRGQQLAWAADGLLAAGGLAVVGAAVLYFLEGRTVAEPGDKARAQRAPMLVPMLVQGGAGVTGSIEF